MPLGALFASEILKRDAIREVVKKSLQEVPDPLPDVSIMNVSTGGGIADCIIVQSFDERIPAEAVLSQYVTIIGKELASLDEPSQLKQRIEEAQRMVEKSAAELLTRRKSLTLLAKLLDVEINPQVAAQQRLQAATEIQRLKLEREGLKARQALLLNQVAKLTARGPDKEAQSIAEELSRVVEGRRKIVAHLTDARERVGDTGSMMQLEASVELAQAESELAKFKRDASQGNSLRASELRQRLEDTEIQLAEIETKLNFLLKSRGAATMDPEQLETERLNLELDEQSYRRAREELDQLQAELRSYVRPHVRLIRTE